MRNRFFALRHRHIHSRLDNVNNPFYKYDLRRVYGIGYVIMRNRMKWSLGHPLKKKGLITILDPLKELNKISYEMADPYPDRRRREIREAKGVLSAGMHFVPERNIIVKKHQQFKVYPTDRKQFRCQICGRYYHTEPRMLVHMQGEH